MPEVCPVCQLKNLKRFKLRGGCLDSSVDQYFVMRSNKEFLGLVQSSIIFSSEQKRWEIVNSTDTTSILAYMESKTERPSFPLGRQAWYFLDVNCTDPDSDLATTIKGLSIRWTMPFCTGMLALIMRDTTMPNIIHFH